MDSPHSSPRDGPSVGTHQQACEHARCQTGSPSVPQQPLGTSTVPRQGRGTAMAAARPRGAQLPVLAAQTAEPPLLGPALLPPPQKWEGEHDTAAGWNMARMAPRGFR